MSKRKYEKGKQIKSIVQFEMSITDFYIWNGFTRHKSVLESLQYRILKQLIENGCIYEAKLKGEKDYEKD